VSPTRDPFPSLIDPHVTLPFPCPSYMTALEPSKIIRAPSPLRNATAPPPTTTSTSPRHYGEFLPPRPCPMSPPFHVRGAPAGATAFRCSYYRRQLRHHHHPVRGDHGVGARRVAQRSWAGLDWFCHWAGLSRASRLSRLSLWARNGPLAEKTLSFFFKFL
jgi:hypothetical protein